MNHPRLLSLATAVPPHLLRQQDAERFARHLFTDVLADDPRLALVFEHDPPWPSSLQVRDERSNGGDLRVERGEARQGGHALVVGALANCARLMI